jgi:CheY-like chemotaxis protein
MNTVLVVDDMAIFRDPIATCLKLADFATLVARDGSEALEMTRRHRPGVILLDLAMPILDGIGFLEAMRA